MKKLLPLLLIVTLASCSGAKKNIVGYWYKPKTQVNVRFFPNKTFEYSDYDSAANKSQKVTGKYSIDGSSVILNFADKTTQTLTIEEVDATSRRYHLKKDDYYFIKDERVNNAVPPPSSSSNPR